MAKKQQRKGLEKWCFLKAQSYRGSWLTRCKKIGGDINTVPSRQEIQDWLMEMDKFRCYITGEFLNRRTLQADHIQPLSRGGTFDLGNVGLTHKRTNQIKGNMTLDEYRDLIKLVSKWEDEGKELFKRLLASSNVYRR